MFWIDQTLVDGTRVPYCVLDTRSQATVTATYCIVQNMVGLGPRGAAGNLG